MKIAIPNHQGRVAPVFDTCRHMLIFSRNENGEVQVAEQDWSTVSRQGRVLRLKELGIDVLLCGAISCGIEDQIHGEGIGLVAWLAGGIPAILNAYTEGTIMDPEHAMPGTLMCRQRRRRRRGIRARMQSNQCTALNTKEMKSCRVLTEQDHMAPVLEPDGV